MSFDEVRDSLVTSFRRRKLNYRRRVSHFKRRIRMRRIRVQIKATVSDKNSWDTLTKRCFFPSRAPLVPLKVVYRGLVTKSCTPTLRGQGDPKVSQPF